MDYLALTNEALRESGASLDALTSTTFVTPTDPMQSKFIAWTAQAWEDIQTERRDWEYMKDSAVIRLLPMMEIADAFSATTLNNMAFSVHDATGTAIFTTLSSGALALESGVLLDGTAIGQLTIASFSGTNFILEPGDDLYANSGSQTFTFRKWGQYDLNTTGYSASGDTGTDAGLGSIAEIDLNSMTLTDFTTDTAGASYTSSDWNRLCYVPPNTWLRNRYDRPTKIGKPTHYTINSNSRLSFYPPLDDDYMFSFDYTKTPQTLTDYDDTPTGLPARFHKAISWRALMYYAQYDNQQGIYNVAKNRYDEFEYKMVRDLLPTVGIGYNANRF